MLTSEMPTHVVSVYLESGRATEFNRKSVWAALMNGPLPNRDSLVVRLRYIPGHAPIIQGATFQEEVIDALQQIRLNEEAVFVAVISKLYAQAFEPLVSNNMSIGTLADYQQLHHYLRCRLMEQLGDGFPWHQYDTPLNLSWRDSEQITGYSDIDYIKACMKRVLDDYPEHYQVLKRFGADALKFTVYISSVIPAPPPAPRLPASEGESTLSPEYIAQVRWAQEPQWQPPVSVAPSYGGSLTNLATTGSSYSSLAPSYGGSSTPPYPGSYASTNLATTGTSTWSYPLFQPSPMLPPAPLVTQTMPDLPHTYGQ